MIGERLAELRKDKGLKQSELAEALKLSTYTVSSYERDKSCPDDDMKLLIAKFFNVSLDYLLGLVDEQIPIGGGKPVFVPENLPLKAISEIKEYVNYIKAKYTDK